MTEHKGYLLKIRRPKDIAGINAQGFECGNVRYCALSGNNMNSQDDIYPLPSPVSANVGRLIDIFSTMKNSSDTDMTGIVQVKVTQGGQVLDTIAEREDMPSGKTVPNQLFINLTS